MVSATIRGMVNEHTMDLVYVVREGEDNDALRYSLRSVEKNLPHRGVIIAGYRPSWVNPDNTLWVQRNQDEYPDLSNTNYNLLAVIENVPQLSDDFVLMNDDFMIMEPVSELQNNHQGDLNAVIERYKKTVMLQAYSLKKTSMFLVQLGAMPPYYSYELHTPFVYNKHKLLDLFKKLTGPNPYLNPLTDMFMIRPRSLYGNFYKIGGEEVADVKGPKPLQQYAWSTEQGAFERGVRGAEQHDTARAILGRAFPRRSKYELSEGVQSEKRQDIHDPQRGASSSLRSTHGAS